MMENQKMASQAQINKLNSLGYQGDAASLTSMEASIAISELIKGNAQPQFNNTNQGGYQAPQQYQATGYQTPSYQQPAAQNQVAVQPQTSYKITTRTGEELNISPEVVEAYVCKDLTPMEFNYFYSVCKTYQLNPFLKDIYAIKFGNQPATFIIDYKVMQQAADNNPQYDGLEVGVIYLDKNGQPQERKGAYILPGETLIGGWCDVFRKDRAHANRTYALYNENVKTTKNGEVNSNWASKPVFMCVKVAKAQALREAFPNMFSNNTYTADEFVRDEETVIDSPEYESATTEQVANKQTKKTATKQVKQDIQTEDWPE